MIVLLKLEIKKTCGPKGPQWLLQLSLQAKLFCLELHEDKANG